MHEPAEGQPIRAIGMDTLWDLIGKVLDTIPQGSKIYGIPRNGTIIALFMSHRRPDLELIIDGNLSPYEEVFIIDDIHDTGKTLQTYIDDEYYRTRTLYWRKKQLYDDVKMSKSISCSMNAPDGWAETVVGDEWILFPWEILHQKGPANVGA